ncbi:type II toxin-antitoxin system RelE/ParE family toxin [soil metagenome]
MFPNKEITIFDEFSLKPNFAIELLPEATNFLETLDYKTREKIYYNFKKAQFVNDNELFKKLNDFIWEFRTLYKSKAYRLFSFWDKTQGNGTLVIATHGIFEKDRENTAKRN